MGADVTPYNIRYTMILTDFLVGIGDISVIVKQFKKYYVQMHNLYGCVNS